MPKRLPDGEQKQNVTIRLKPANIEKLRKIPNYSNLIEYLIENYFAYIERQQEMSKKDE